MVYYIVSYRIIDIYISIFHQYRFFFLINQSNEVLIIQFLWSSPIIYIGLVYSKEIEISPELNLLRMRLSSLITPTLSLLSIQLWFKARSNVRLVIVSLYFSYFHTLSLKFIWGIFIHKPTYSCNLSLACMSSLFAELECDLLFEINTAFCGLSNRK